MLLSGKRCDNYQLRYNAKFGSTAGGVTELDDVENRCGAIGIAEKQWAFCVPSFSIDGYRTLDLDRKGSLYYRTVEKPVIM